MKECASDRSVSPFVVEGGFHGETLAAAYLAVLDDRPPVLRINASLVGSERLIRVIGWATAGRADGCRAGILRARDLRALMEEVQDATT